MTSNISRISKSQYLKGMQCPKALWFYRHRPDLFPDIPATKQHLFDSGHEVGILAQGYFEDGIEITEQYNEIDQAIESTEKAVANGYSAIFEATACSYDGAYSRIDILNKVEQSDDWDLIEVKMSTTVKEYHYDDMTFQRYAFEQAGYKVRKSILMHLNRDYEKKGNIDPKELFTLEDCTDAVCQHLSGVTETLADLLDLVNLKDEPEIDIGDHCKKPFLCDYFDHCWQHIPDYSVYNIFKGARLQDLLGRNIVDVADVPVEVPLRGKKVIDVMAYRNDEVYVEKGNIRGFLSLLEYPLYYLDYETIFPAIPLYDKSSPYQQIPFQFSLHIQESLEQELIHLEFLHTKPTDPRPDFAKALIKTCGTKGSVVVYNRGFESRINRELGKSISKYRTDLENINNRMVDLLIPFRSRYLYHPKMKGSASLKSVLPAFVPDLNYDELEIADGSTASMMYLNCIQNRVSETEKEFIYNGLRKYCELDTLAEVKLIDVLYQYS